VPGVIKKKKHICKKRKYFKGSIRFDSPKQPGAKNG
jgi:hypothetical protein